MHASSKRSSSASAPPDKVSKKAKLSEKTKVKVKELSLEDARKIVEVACKEADDVMQSMKEPDKKPKTLKPSIREEVILMVRKGDPSIVLQFIKSNKKEFVSGVFSSVFMSAIRKGLNSRCSTDTCTSTENEDLIKRQKICVDENRALMHVNSKSEIAINRGKQVETSDAVNSDPSDSSTVEEGGIF